MIMEFYMRKMDGQIGMTKLAAEFLKMFVTNEPKN
jgi:hypothetical protein